MGFRIKENQNPGNYEQPDISVCMIVKNESDHLGQCLESIKEMDAELIVFDTGSTDNTIEIAESYGAKVFNSPWCDDFSFHRNESIEKANGRWIFIIDADEEMAPKSAKMIKDSVGGLPELISACVVTVKHETQGNNNSVRLFRNNVGIHYEYAVHNELVFDGEVAFIEAPILHHGYHLDLEKMQLKFNRTARILQTEYEKEPENPRWSHYLAISFATTDRIDLAIAFAGKSISECKDRNDKIRYISSYYVLASCLLEQGHYQHCQMVCEDCLKVESEYIDIYAVLIKLNAKLGIEYRHYEDKYKELYNIRRDTPELSGALPAHTLNLYGEMEEREVSAC